MVSRELVFLSIWCFIALCSLSVGGVAQSADPLAELEAWNKIKESTVAADYHAFLQKFPDGSLAARAREKMNALGDPVWNELKKSNDPFKYRDYIRANPNSPFLDQAKARLEVLTVAAVEWEKVKSSNDMRRIMTYIAAGPTPFTEDAKAAIEPILWKEISGSSNEEYLEFYAKYYGDTAKGKEAVARYTSNKAKQRSDALSALKAAILGASKSRYVLSGIQGYSGWHEYSMPQDCRLDITHYYNPRGTASTYATSIDLSRIQGVYPGPKTETWRAYEGVWTVDVYQETGYRIFVNFVNYKGGKFEHVNGSSSYEHKGGYSVGKFNSVEDAKRFNSVLTELVQFCRTK